MDALDATSLQSTVEQVSQRSALSTQHHHRQRLLLLHGVRCIAPARHAPIPPPLYSSPDPHNPPAHVLLQSIPTQLTQQVQRINERLQSSISGSPSPVKPPASTMQSAPPATAPRAKIDKMSSEVGAAAVDADVCVGVVSSNHQKRVNAAAWRAHGQAVGSG